MFSSSTTLCGEGGGGEAAGGGGKNIGGAGGGLSGSRFGVAGGGIEGGEGRCASEWPGETSGTAGGAAKSWPGSVDLKTAPLTFEKSTGAKLVAKYAIATVKTAHAMIVANCSHRRPGDRAARCCLQVPNELGRRCRRFNQLRMPRRWPRGLPVLLVAPSII